MRTWIRPFPLLIKVAIVNEGCHSRASCEISVLKLGFISHHTVPIDKILSVKNARAWVSMVSY